MSRRRKQPHRAVDDDLLLPVKRVTRSQSRQEQQRATGEQELMELEMMGTRVANAFMSALIPYQDLFFDRLLPSLDTDSLLTLLEALSITRLGLAVLRNSQQWRYVIKRDGLAGASTAFTHTVKCCDGCAALTRYLSLRSQLESFDTKVVVVNGDLERITHVNDHRVDCLVFPTSSTFRNPRTGVAGSVHRRAGAGLDRHLAKKKRTARSPHVLVTHGFDSGTKRLIHCVGPHATARDRTYLLYQTYVNALHDIEKEHEVHCAAIASISTGIMRYPSAEAAEVALSAVRDVLRTCKWPNKVLAFVCIDKTVLEAFRNAHKRIRSSFITAEAAFPADTHAALPNP